VFEWITTRLGSQGTIAGGGRYDGLIGQLGGKAAPACGFAVGVERIVLLLKEYQFVAPARPADAYVVYAGDGTAARRCAWPRACAMPVSSCSCTPAAAASKNNNEEGRRERGALCYHHRPEELAAGEVSLKSLRAADAQVRVAPARWPESSNRALERSSQELGNRMATYDLEEQEQLASLKAWWKEHGGAILSARLWLLAAIAGLERLDVVSTLAVRAGRGAVRHAAKGGARQRSQDGSQTAGAILENFPRSAYAPLAALVSAKVHFQAGDLKTARAQLQWVIEHIRER